MKLQHQATAQDLEERLRFLDEFKRIRDEETGANDGNEDDKDGEESQDVSPARSFFSRNKVRNRSITKVRLFQGSLGKPCSPHQE